ncbi:hypothetical protein MTR67_052073 [Solanum verrucosum]|uniref:Reverse transcriptase/retrotransposon-derived protein RNase H-like domain-containing protein n=1 Tax=Solanum verrucosum TaxID=315347 RepID=A0AAF0V4F1_SOLVR|nr:hypothetical protein MTR67_052073 [Solanum verrucosum]
MKLTEKLDKFQWTEACKHSFQELKDRLTSTPVLELPEGSEGYAVYYDAFGVGGFDIGLWKRHIIPVILFTLVKVEHQKPDGLVQEIVIPLWKWEAINIDFITSIMSPNDPEHDDAEGWCKTAVKYTERPIAELIGDSD